MRFFMWHQKLIKKLSTRNLALAIVGKVLAIFALGSMFAIQLDFLAKILLFLGVVLVLSYSISSLLDWHSGKESKYIDHFFGYLGGLLLMLHFGIQFPEILYQTWILALGIVLVLPGTFNLFKK